MYAGKESVGEVAAMVWRCHDIESSALFRAMAGDEAEWTLSNQLRAAGVDALNVANWQRSADGEKGRNQPKPIPRPGVASDSTSYGKGGGLPLDEMAEWLGWTKSDSPSSN